MQSSRMKTYNSRTRRCMLNCSFLTDSMVKQMPPNIERYLVHDNGSYSFCVKVDKQKIEIFELEMLEADKELDEVENALNVFQDKLTGIWLKENSMCWSSPYLRVLPGRDNAFGANKPQDFAAFKGNTVLVELADPGKYIYVGASKLYTFKPPETISEFWSPVGNNDVPYPYALSKSFCYLMLDKVCFPLSLVEGIPSTVSPYDFAYSQKDRIGFLLKFAFPATDVPLPSSPQQSGIPFNKLPRGYIRRIDQLTVGELYRLFWAYPLSNNVPAAELGARLLAKNQKSVSFLVEEDKAKFMVGEKEVTLQKPRNQREHWKSKSKFPLPDWAVKIYVRSSDKRKP